MPDVTDSPEGVHPHVKVHLTDHPDGPIALWVKQRVHFMGVEEAATLARELLAWVERVPVKPAPPVKPPEVEPNPRSS